MSDFGTLMVRSLKLTVERADPAAIWKRAVLFVIRLPFLKIRFFVPALDP